MEDPQLREKMRIALGAGEEELFAAIGGELARGELGAMPRSLPELAAAGREWFAVHIVEIRSKVCVSPFIRKAMDQQSDDPITIAMLVFDLTASIAGKVIGVFVASVIVRRGLKLFCSEPVNPPPTDSQGEQGEQREQGEQGEQGGP